MRLDRDRALGTLLTAALLAGAAYLVLQPGFVSYYFAGPGANGPWWQRAVWGNVWACVPCGVLAFLYARAKLAAHRKAQHEEHLERMAQAEKHHQEQREHAEWQFHAMHALHHGESLPEHPHFHHRKDTP